MNASDTFAVLMEQIGFPGSQRLRPILEYLLTPEAARWVAALPGTAADVAATTGDPVDRIAKELDDLFFKGVVFARGDYQKREFYRFARSIGQLHDASQAYKGIDIVKDKHYFEMWQDFVMNEMYPSFAKRRQEAGAPPQRVVPAYRSIQELPGVLPFEDYRELLKAQQQIVAVPCSCRYRTTAVGEHCDRVSEEERWNCLQLARSADYNLARGAGRELTIDEAVALVDKMESEGLVHMWPNSSQMTGVNTTCNCCRDCCMDYVPLDQAGLSVGLSWEKSRYAAYVASSDACNGCQTCIDRCQFDAIEMTKVAGAKKLKVVVDEAKCWGCGVCVVSCEPTALKMKAIRPAEFIPAVAAPH